MKKFTFFMMSLFLMLGTAMAQNYSLTETGISSEELNAKTAPTLIAIKNLSATNNYYFVGNTGAAPYSAAEFSDAAVFVWQPVEEGVAGSYYLMKLDGTYMQATSPKDFGTVDGAAVFTTTNPTTAGTGSTNFNGDGDSQAFIVDEALLVRFVNAAGTWINVQNGDNGTPTYNSGLGGWTIHHIYAVEEAAVEPEPEVIPAANKSYTVVAEGHTNVSRPQWAINDEGTAFVSTGSTTVSTDAQKQFAFVTYKEAIYIYSISAKKFVMKDASLSDKNPDAVQLTKLDNGKFFFKFDADHNVNIGGSGQMTIDRWSTIDGGNQFTLTEAGDFDPTEALAMLSNVATITYQFQYEGNVVATQEVIAVPGEAYPDYTLSAPYGVTGAAKPEGTVSGDETVTIELTITKALPFEAVAEGEPTKWYYAQIHGNFLSYMTNPGIGAEMPWKVNGELITAVDEANADNYTWGFVGDLWTGFKVVSKAGGAIKSTGSGNITIVENIEDATAFIAMAPNTNDNAAAESGFCLLNAEAGQYINAQNVGVNHWTANDAGSTIVVTEREITVEPEPEVTVEIDATKEYYLKSSWNYGMNSGYLALGNKSGANYGHAYMANDNSQAFKFTLVEDGANKYYTLSTEITGTMSYTAYIDCSHASNVNSNAMGGSNLLLELENATSSKYVVKTANGYLKADMVSYGTDGSAYHVFSNGDRESALVFELVEKADAPDVAAPVITEIIPANGAEVTSLSEIVITFDKAIKTVDTMNGIIKVKTTGSTSRAYGYDATISDDGLTVTFPIGDGMNGFKTIDAEGEYTIEIPAGVVTSTDGAKNEAATYTFTIATPVVKPETFTVTAALFPTVEGDVTEIKGIRVEAGQGSALAELPTGWTLTNEAGDAFTMKIEWLYDYETILIMVNPAITEAGTYTLTIPAGSLKTEDGKECEAAEFRWTIAGTVEPEPETPATLNETVVFDFVNGGWNIPTMEANNYSSIKTAGEYTDGTKTINIDPTANGGSYIYDSKGFLNISKPGTKIILPAFGFAVEKIEVVGHASATSYANVDMNVYVGSTAVSTACIGSTETYTYEIAADNQAAGNVYELVIGSNGGNYSSVMYITYIKVYPAENKLEAPVIDLASGVYVGAQTVNVHSATADIEGVTNVTYYYTTDGNEPTVEDEETDGEITITESCTLKVIVELTYGDKTYVSASTSAEYIISEAVTFHRATAVESGIYFLAANGNVAAPLANGVLPAVETTIDGDDLTEAVYYAITLEEAAEAGTYYIKDVNGNYIYTSSMYGTSGPKLSSNGAHTPMSSWTITIADDENSTATIVSEGLTLVYDTAASAFKVTESVSDGMVLPTFYGTIAIGVENVVINGEAIESIYDLQGRKLEKVTEGGIYIVNGKKILVK